MLRKLIIGSSLLVGSMLVGMTGAYADSCVVTDQACIRDQVIANIGSGLPVLFNLPIGDRPGNTLDLNSPSFQGAIANLQPITDEVVKTNVNQFLATNGQQIFQKLQGLGNGIFLTRLADVLQKLGFSAENI